MYAYSSLGELAGWFIGWNLTLEYSFAAAAIAGTWSTSMASFFKNLNVNFPKWLYFVETNTGNVFQINLLGFLLVLLVGIFVMRGLKSGSGFTVFITCLNLGIIVFIIVAGAVFVKSENITSNFVPFGFDGIIQGTTFMFFAFVGFDTVCTLTADAKNAKRDIPIAVIATIGTATILYVAVGFVLNGMVPYYEISKESPLASAFVSVEAGWASHIVSICALTTMFATLFACLLGQPKIFASMALDGLLPKNFATMTKAGIPVGSTIFTIILTALLTLCINVDSLMDMTSVGTLFGFASISAGLMVLRFQGHPSLGLIGPLVVLVLFIGSLGTSFLVVYGVHMGIYISAALVFVLCPFLLLNFFFFKFKSDLVCKTPNGFVCPLMPILPCFSIIANNYVLCELSITSIIQFLIWTAIGFALYFAFGIRKSELRKEEADIE